jgi:hypothetical protein
MTKREGPCDFCPERFTCQLVGFQKEKCGRWIDWYDVIVTRKGKMYREDEEGKIRRVR